MATKKKEAPRFKKRTFRIVLKVTAPSTDTNGQNKGRVSAAAVKRSLQTVFDGGLYIGLPGGFNHLDVKIVDSYEEKS